MRDHRHEMSIEEVAANARELRRVIGKAGEFVPAPNGNRAQRRAAADRSAGRDRARNAVAAAKARRLEREAGR